MNEREFKLLVRGYFQARTKRQHCDRTNFEKYMKKENDLEKRILTELEAFTVKEQEELPFKD